jgi:TetR/AcrR family transcriptional regulator
MDNSLPTTEERILEAAKKVFHTRGFEGARMQDIANEAGVNKALVHYYFRNKENLFKAVFEDAFRRVVAKVKEIFVSDLSFTEKIEIFLKYYISYLSQNSYLPLFIINSMYEKPGQLKEILEKIDFSPETLLVRIREQVRDELHLDIDPFHIYINILSLSIFPVVARPLIQTIFSYSNEQMTRFYEERTSEVPVFILNALKGYENNFTK